jgi:hypothetical protein
VFRCACGNGQLPVVERLLSLEGDRRIDVHAHDEWAFRSACKYGGVHVVDRLLSLEGDRAIPARVLDELGVVDRAPRLLISEWADARERKREGRPQRAGNGLTQLWRKMPRGALAEVLEQMRRPW